MGRYSWPEPSEPTADPAARRGKRESRTGHSWPQPTLWAAWLHSGLSVSPPVTGPGVSRRPRSDLRRGPEVAAPAAPAAKSLESAGYPQRRVAADSITEWH